MKKILFLDFDGVLNTERHHEHCYENGIAPVDRYGYAFDPEAVANLKRIIDETGADIVVSDTPCMREVYGGAATYIDPRRPAPIVVEDIPDSVKKSVLGRYGWDRSASIMKSLLTV